MPRPVIYAAYAGVSECEIVEADIDGIHRLYRERRLTPLQLVDAYLNRIGSLELDTDAGPPLNCIVHVAPGVRDDAAALTTEIAACGVMKPLHGIPVWIKDNIDVAGSPTTNGCLALADGVAAHDAVLVRNLRSAGAIVMGKVGMTELGSGSWSYSTMSGRIGNALDPRNPPGGSSSGSAVAVSANFGMLAVGVDDCGSITGPAALNCCVGFKPTIGLVSGAGLSLYCRRETSAGPITRTVADAATMLQALIDPFAPSGRAATRGERSLGGTRIGLLARAGGLDMSARLAARIKRAFATCLGHMEHAGADLVQDVNVEGIQLRRSSRLSRYNSQRRSLRSRTVAPQSVRELFFSDRLAPHNHRQRTHPLVKYRWPCPLPDVFAWAHWRTVHRNQRALARAMNDRALDVLVAVTAVPVSALSTVTQIPHLSVPAGIVEADREMAGRGFVLGSKVAWGISILGRVGADCEVLVVGCALERMFRARRQLPAKVAPGPERSFDIDAFNRLKRRIAHESYRTLHLDEKGQRYVHPTAEEFRAIVRTVTGSFSQSDCSGGHHER